MADFGGEHDAFRAEARAWLEAHFPPALKGRGAMMYQEGGPSQDADFKAWAAAMGEKGWGTPTWPKAYGGGGLSAAEARVLQQEMGRIGAWSPIGGMGVMMMLPARLIWCSERPLRRCRRFIVPTSCSETT